MKKNLRILILEDSEDDVDLIKHQLKKGEFSITSTVVETREQYEEALQEFKPDVVLSDHSLPMFDSVLALQIFQSYRKISHPAAAFILVTGTVSEEFAVQIMREGADDYILKDRLKRLPSAVQNAIEKNRLRDQRRKEEEEKLYLFDILQRSLHEIYLINPRSSKFEYANKQAFNNLGYPPEELYKLTPIDTIKDLDKNRFKNSVQLAERSLQGLILEREAVRKDGSSYPVQIHLQVIEQGEQKRILANVLDITEAKEMELQKELISFIQDSFSYQRDLQESLELVLKKLCETCSCVAAEVFSREFDLPGSKLLASYNNYIRGGSTTGSLLSEEAYESSKTKVYTSGEDWIRKEDAKWLKSASVKTAVAIPIILWNEIIAVIVIYSNQENAGKSEFTVLSEQVQNKLAENIKRKKSEEELQKIFNFSPDLMIVLGKDGIVKKINPALQKILGYKPEKMLNSNFLELLHPGDLDVIEEWQAAQLENNEVAHYESRWLDVNGEYKTFSWSVTPYMKGNLHFAVGRNITETKKHMLAIQEQNKRLTDIAWEQSHVVRAPLTRLMACVEYLQETGSDFDKILENVKSSAYEIDTIIKGIINRTEKVEVYEKS